MQNDIVKLPVKPEEPGENTHNQPENEAVHTQPQSTIDEASTKDNQEASSSAINSIPAHKEGIVPEAPKSPPRKKPMMVIAIAVVVFIGLAVGAVYATLNNKNDKPVASTTSQTPAPTTTIADTSSDINDALNDASQLPTSNEDPASDLSDQTLGL